MTLRLISGISEPCWLSPVVRWAATTMRGDMHWTNRVKQKMVAYHMKNIFSPSLNLLPQSPLQPLGKQQAQCPFYKARIVDHIPASSLLAAEFCSFVTSQIWPVCLNAVTLCSILPVGHSPKHTEGHGRRGEMHFQLCWL